MKSVVWWSIGLLCGLGMMAIGLFGTVGSDIVLCGSEKMQPGQICESTQYGQKSSESYEEKLQESIDADRAFQNGGRWVTFGIGAGIVAACGWRLTVAIRRRVRQGAGVASQAVPGHQPGFVPPPGFAPQDGFPQQGVPVRQDFSRQPGFQQQGFAPPQWAQQTPPPGYQPPQGPYQQ